MYTLLYLFSIFMVEKCDFLQVVRNLYLQNRSFPGRGSFIFPKRGWLFPVSTFKGEYFNEEMSFLAGLKKNYSISRKSTDFGRFWLPGSTFKVDFLHVGNNFQKIFGTLLRESCSEHYVKFWAFYLFWPAGGNRFASWHFPESAILASCNFVGRPFVACYACPIVFFHFSQ